MQNVPNIGMTVEWSRVFFYGMF